MSITISAAERDALYEQIHARLSGIDGIWLAAEAGDFEAAERLAREYSDDLRLVLEDLGWGESEAERFELTTPPEILRRSLARMQGRVEAERALEAEERAEWLAREEEGRRLMDACGRVLRELD